MKAVFDVNPGSKFKHDVWRRYEIPNRRQADIARQCIGDWIVFRWTKSKVRDGSYFAVACVECIEPDPERPTYFLARIRHYLPFPRLVPLSERGRYAETQLLSATHPSQIGRMFQGRPIRLVWDADFAVIAQKGFSHIELADEQSNAPVEEPSGFADAVIETWSDQPGLRRVDEVLRHLPFRDANFRLNVGRAYGHTCAFTGLKLLSGRGHCETHAAHLWAVTDGGPDIVTNGICANRTIHWAFDEHLLSIDENNRPLVARNAELLAYLHQFPKFGEFVRLPRYPSQYPDPDFLHRHRTAFRRRNRI